MRNACILYFNFEKVAKQGQTARKKKENLSLTVCSCGKR